MDNLMGKAGRESALLGDTYIGTEHLLLALVADDEDSQAAAALRGAGIRYSSLFEAAQARPESAVSRIPTRRPVVSKGVSPLYYNLQGRAEGFAAADGARRVEAEHLLLALLWEPHGRHAHLLESLGTTRRRVQRRLAAGGVPVPPRLPPAPDDTRWGQPVTTRVSSNDVWGLAGLLRPLLPDGAPFRFNFGNGKAWFSTGEGIDLAPLIRKARRQQLANRSGSSGRKR
jgi:hypothetical protein